MFRTFAANCFPRIRGDVPGVIRLRDEESSFSPHTRGCSGTVARCTPRSGSFPRIRGDVPAAAPATILPRTFSPHTRGCSGEHHGFLPHRLVFPAYAGMFRFVILGIYASNRFPRIRGDVPYSMHAVHAAEKFSPHTRGCSLRAPVHERSLAVFPAYAGMFLCSPRFWLCRLGFPRIRGDVPILQQNIALIIVFSPHTRGCSLYTP